MRKVISLFFAYFLAANTAIAQQKCIVIVDSTEKQPVPFATLYLEKAKVGFYADDMGRFCVNSFSDSVRISSVGYQTLKIPTNRFNSVDTILLTRKITYLSEVIVKARTKSINYTKLGFSNKSILTVNSYNPNSGYRLATFIDTKNYNNNLIKKIICELSPNRKSIINKYKIRIAIYSNDSYTKLPLKDISTKDITVDVLNSDKKIEVDMSDYLSISSQGLWISIESVGYFVNDVYYPIDDRQHGKNTRLSDKKKTGNLSPSYVYIKSGEKNSAVSRWGNKWHYETYVPNLTFCFSIIVENI